MDVPKVCVHANVRFRRDRETGGNQCHRRPRFLSLRRPVYLVFFTLLLKGVIRIPLFTSFFILSKHPYTSFFTLSQRVRIPRFSVS